MALYSSPEHTDHSTDKGFQFEFFCDRCGNGFIERVQSLRHGDGRQPPARGGKLFGAFWGRQARQRMRLSARAGTGA